MDPPPIRRRIAEQFSYRGERADVWRAFDFVLDTDAFLNLGFSERYRPHLLGSPQRRLADQVGERLAARLPTTTGTRLLDVGCGRGGPAITLAERFGFDVFGIDLVPYNVKRARENARDRAVDAEFVVGDATQLPFAPGSFAACAAVDSLVYVPDRAAVFSALADVLDSDGVLVVSDLLTRSGLDGRERGLVESFATAWDMQPPGTFTGYRRALEAAGFAVEPFEDITANSVGRFRKWTTAFLALARSPLGPLLSRLLRAAGLDPERITTQVRRAHAALPYLRHGIITAVPK
jgi:ubiquinone/menaquinone biosynthesis C-methylase UbiE